MARKGVVKERLLQMFGVAKPITFRGECSATPV